MTLEETIAFAQDNFGADTEIPQQPDNGRPPIPTWLEDRGTTAVEIGADDELETEGDINPDSDDYLENPGIDALAYYLPFHFYRKGWGTYVRAVGIYALARRISYRGRVSRTTLNIAFKILIEHERMHFL